MDESSSSAIRQAVISAWSSYKSYTKEYEKLSLLIKLLQLIAPFRFLFPRISVLLLNHKHRLHTLDSQMHDKSFVLRKRNEKIWSNVVQSYDELLRSKKIWIIIGSYAIDQVAERTPAMIDRRRREVSFEQEEVSFIKSEQSALFFPDVTGDGVFIYPEFCISFDKHVLHFYPQDEIHIAYESVLYIETDSIPSDARLLKQTWEKANVDGTADKRFRDNTMLPVYEYGMILLKVGSETHRLLVSNCEPAKRFVTSYLHYRDSVSKRTKD